VKEGAFEHPRSIGTIYVDRADGDNMANPRLVMARVGEDAEKVVAAFWDEWPTGDFVIAPIFFYGLAPRRSLCSAKSIASALQTIQLEPNSILEQKWKELAEQFNVAWPKRLQPQATKAA
jgi:hypothetical protein